MRAFLLVLFAGIVVGCAPIEVNDPVPAIKLNLSLDAIIEIRQVIANELDQDKIKVNNSAFMERSKLPVQRVKIVNSRGRKIQGRELSMPDYFQLFVKDGDCLLFHEKNSSWEKLHYTTCVTERRKKR